MRENEKEKDRQNERRWMLLAMLNAHTGPEYMEYRRVLLERTMSAGVISGKEREELSQWYTRYRRKGKHG